MNEQHPREQRLAGGSSLVRRLVQAQRDPVKRRARRWLVAMGDQRLSEFGLTPADIAVLRSVQASVGADQLPFTGRVVGAVTEDEVAAFKYRPAGTRRSSSWQRKSGLIAASAGPIGR
jgi:uncharacterized protein YjiS (DUF1127 family)